MKTLTTREVTEALCGTICFCGAPKGKGLSFCPPCYHVLTRAEQAVLYRRIGEGYLEAYLAAVKRLEPLAQDAPHLVTRELIFAALRATRCCVCGGPKANGQSFCRCCYDALTKPQQAALRIGEGYEEAFRAALLHLAEAERDAARRTRPSPP